MLHDVKEDYVKSIKNSTSSYDKKHFRYLASSDFNGWPSPIEEKWRLSRLGALSRLKIKPIEPNLRKSSIHNKTIGSNIIKFVDGAFRKDLSSNLPPSIILKELNEIESLEFLKKIKKSDLNNHPSTNASLSCTPSIIKLTVDEESNFEELIEITYEGGDDDFSVHPVLYIELKKNSKLSLIEHFNHKSTLVMPLQLIEVQEKAYLSSIKIYNDNCDTYNLSAHCALLSKDSKYNSFSLVKGGIFTRSETHAYLNGSNANLNLNGVYISGKKQHHDLTTAIYHNVPDCTSKQIVRGVLGGFSTGVFQGKVKVSPDAQRTDGQQMSKAILVSQDAKANAKPELEIYADDVICAHGATVGELDDDQLFYLNSRGIGKNKAREILIKAFLHDIISESVDNKYHDYIFNEAQTSLSSILNEEKIINE